VSDVSWTATQQYEPHDSTAYALSLARPGIAFRQRRRQQWLLVHVLEDRRRISQAAAREEQAAFHRIVKQGPPPGLLAFDGERPVGWCQLTPREDLSWLNRKQALVPVDEMPVFAVSCFYVRSGYRRRGIMAALIAEALKTAKSANAPALEAYPVDTAQAGSTSNVFTGTASTFRRLGFRTVARRLPSRPIMRHDLRGIAP
jgi:GNAT superfamily N-acetyltransferase